MHEAQQTLLGEMAPNCYHTLPYMLRTAHCGPASRVACPPFYRDLSRQAAVRTRRVARL